MDNPGFWMGWAGGIIGSVVGILGGVFGTWMSIKNTTTPAERAFMVRCAIWTWIAVTLFVVAMIFVPAPYKFFLWIPYALAMIVAIPWMNRIQAKLRTASPSAKG